MASSRPEIRPVGPTVLARIQASRVSITTVRSFKTEINGDVRTDKVHVDGRELHGSLVVFQKGVEEYSTTICGKQKIRGYNIPWLLNQNGYELTS